MANLATPIQVVNVQIPRGLVERLDLFADATGRTRSSAIRYAVMRLLQDFERDAGQVEA